MYLDFDTYQTLGGTLTNVIAFNNLEYKCEKIVNHYTSNRLQKVLSQEEQVDLQHLMFELVERHNQTENNIASVSNDGYSVSYANKGVDAIMKEDESLILDYFPDYCYLGVC